MSTVSRSLVDEVVVVTGASSGIGAATAQALSDEGARLVLGARGSERLEGVSQAFDPDRTIALSTDVRIPEECERLVNEALQRYGRVDALVANAGIGAYGGIMDHSNDELREMIDTNFAGTVWAIRAAIPAMLDGGGGDIVVVASVAGLRGGANEAVYAATKAAQIGLAGAIDRETRPSNIRVTTICPAATSTEFAMGAGRTHEMPELESWMTPEDIARAIVFTLQQPRRLRTTQLHMWSSVESS